MSPGSSPSSASSVSRTTSQRRTYALAILTVTATAAVYARFTLSPLQEAIQSDLSLTDNQIALLQGPALAIPGVVCAIPLGLAADKMSRGRLLFILTSLIFSGGLLTAFASNFETLLLGRIVVGAAVPAISTAIFSLIGDLCPPEQRGRASILIAVGQYMGLSAAFMFGGLLLGKLGFNGWHRVIFYLDLPIVLIACILLQLAEPAREPRPSEEMQERGSFRELWQHRHVVGTIVTGLVMGDMAVFAVLTWALPAFVRSFSLPPERIGALMSATVLVSGVIGPAVGGFLADACQKTGGTRKTVYCLSLLALVSCPVGLFPVMKNLAAAIVMLVSFSTIGNAILVTGIALTTVVVPRSIRGLTIAFSASVQNLVGIGLVPLIVSTLSAALGGGAKIGIALAIVCTVAGIVASVTFASGARRFSPAHPQGSIALSTSSNGV